MIFTQYTKHPEHKGLGPDGSPCGSETAGLLERYSVTATEFTLTGKKTERGWEQSEDISTLLPSLVRYQNSGVVGEQLRQRLRQIPLADLERETGLSRHTILRARRGEKVHLRSRRLLKIAICKVPIRKQ